jgi:hypothetical protein
VRHFYYSPLTTELYPKVNKKSLLSGHFSIILGLVSEATILLIASLYELIILIFDTNLSMQTTPSSVHRHPAKPPTAQTYPPSVPLYVYRELAAELQSTQAKLDALTTQNHQLEQENQLLRQEITKVVQSVLHLQKFADSSTKPSSHPATPTVGEVKSPAKQPVTEARPRQQASRSRSSVVTKVPRGKSHHSESSVLVEEINPPIPETVFIEEQEVSYYPPRETEVKEFSGWWLAITILLIMLTAFGAGYLIVRPLFEHQNR